MGTSTRWKGPNGHRWSSAARRLARWDGESRNADQRLEEIAADHLRALHETLRDDRSAFGLYDTACAAGERLAGALGSLAVQGAQSESELIARLASEVGGGGGTLADAAVRRGVAEAVRDLRGRHPELDDAMEAASAGGGFAWDILCDLYQVFFADMVGEFLRSAVAEHVKLAVPVLVATDPEGRIADWVAEKLVDLVPNPCEESAEAAELAKAVDTAQSVVGAVEDPSAVLSKVAEGLVPKAVGRVLGLITDEVIGEGGAAA
ncbi:MULTISPECIES: hypothetical protein [Streptomycetaceae]|uniref:hypothetical protein n=1 Tax=Streptomycetaceae TaxID=2062 RepID=UPI001180F39B|nr:MULTISPECIES: hypothetical protein [Streptomyces]MCC0575114.1 hypothetical protein [Streptomyces californicus]MYU33175.1 hypothetical protein [Streptomyces sp. SID8358]